MILAGSDDDWMKIWNTNGTLSSGDTCRGATGWASPTYGINYIDLSGQNGEDYILTGATDTWAWGGDDDDEIIGYTASSQLRGDDEDNILWAGADDIEFFGNAGDDCVFAEGYGDPVFAMGGGTDVWSYFDSACPSTFEVRVTDWRLCGNPSMTTEACP